MNIPPRVRPDSKLRRDREIEALDSEGGDLWRSSNKPQTYACHERLDHVALIANNLDDWVVSHPPCLLNAEWSASASSALDMLWSLYYQIGDVHRDGEDRPWIHRQSQRNSS